jgi:ABC-type sugar transport system ATPase subunit
LEVRGLRRAGQFENVSFTIRKGESLGLYGLLGSGQDAVIRTIAGEWRPDAGEIWIKGKQAAHLSPELRRQEGIGYVPADRKREGLALPLPVRDNIMLGNLDVYARWGIVDRPREMTAIARWMEGLRIRPRLPTLEARKLSGGNQQKVVLARWLMARSRILFLDEPTQGIDVGAKEEVHRLMVEFTRRRGGAVVLISSDLPEVLRMADRVLVMREGRIVAEIGHDVATQEVIMAHAAGSR